MADYLTKNYKNHELKIAWNFVQYTDNHIFLTGKAGTGKTTFLRNLSKNGIKRMIVTAPTGVAAINAGGVTLHSFFQLPFGPFF
ncbi:MAG: helicase, partial [Deltaproteobacteria bacterium]|nr:helicase [Deltaproteobacteria bacterium]